MEVVRTGVLVLLLAPAFAAALTPEQKKLDLASFDQVWRTVKSNHWDAEWRGPKWDSIHAELRPKVEKAKTRDDSRAAMREMLARLNQSHFAIIPSAVYDDVSPAMSPRPSATERPPGSGTCGIEVRVAGGQAIVFRVHPGSDAEKQGVKPGWTILAIDADELKPVIDRVTAAYSGQTTTGLVLPRAIEARMSGPEGDTVKLTFDTGVKTLLLGPARGKMARFGLLPPLPVWFETRKIGKAGYIAFNWFLDPARIMSAFGDAVATYTAAPGIIIDLRGNPGGLGIMAMGMAGWFIDKPDTQLGVMTMLGNPLKFFVNPREPYFKGKVAILVDGASASTSEIFAGGMQDLHRARVFGTKTAGAALPSIIEKLPNGDGFQYATANYVSQSGRPLEGVGVTPDVEVGVDAKLLRAGRDAAVEAALQWIQGDPK